MLGKLKKSNSEGFTIIEIMIVLVIAGLILLIVFLAIPALQRNARNTQRHNDVGAVATSINNFITDNNGLLPDTITVAASGGQLKVSNSAVATSTPVSDGKAGFYTAVSVVAYAAAPTYGLAPSHNLLSSLFATAYAVASPPPVLVGPDNLYVVTGASCSSSSAIAAGSSRSFAMMYELEQAGSTATGGGVKQCQSS